MQEGSKMRVPGRPCPRRGPGPTEMVTWRIARNPGFTEVPTEPAGVQNGVQPGVPDIPEMGEIQGFT